MKKRLFRFIALLIFATGPAAVTGQVPEDPLMVSGQIVNAATGEPAPFVHIINPSTNQGATTDARGQFTIRMDRQDTLVFSSVGFEKYLFTLENQPADKKVFVKIALNTATLELEPLEIFAFRDAETFKEAILELELPGEPEPIHIPGTYQGPRREVKPGVMSPISFVFSKFSKKEKEKAKLVQAMKDTEHLSRLKAKYDFIKRIARLKDNELEEFLEFCQLTRESIDSYTEYEIALVVNACMVGFKAAGEN